jgi:DNA repair protein RadA/Sms
MARAQKRFVCQKCSTVFSKWAGQCEACGEWNSLSEEGVETGGVGGRPTRAGKATKGRAIPLMPMDGESPDRPRHVTGIADFDRVCGGGLVPGSALLVGGDPGIGKSTLLLQVMAALARGGKKAIYISGEEAIEQVRMRARRLDLADADVGLAAETHLPDIIATLEAEQPVDAVVIDSIQTMWSDSIDSAPGSVSQVRGCSQDLIRVAKGSGVAVIIVGHVTKDGQIAGPRVMEHMVDTVLYFEGERGHHFRILRAVKNRFGPTNEIGVFDMGEKGLGEVPNPSALFIGDRTGDSSGTTVFAGIEGTRPVLVEIQTLVSDSSLGTPRRAVVGWDTGRLSMVLAVLDSRCGLSLSGQDVYLNVAGGLRIAEPAADLAVAASLISSLQGKALPDNSVFFGEISLSGAVRAVNQMEPRLKEAAKLGFTRAIVPKIPERQKPADCGLDLIEVPDLAALIAHLTAGI